jgi:hypothetical protein
MLRENLNQEKLTKSDELYTITMLGTELIGSALAAVEEEKIGQYLDDVLKMIKAKAKARHPSFAKEKTKTKK